MERLAAGAGPQWPAGDLRCHEWSSGVLGLAVLLHASALRDRGLHGRPTRVTARGQANRAPRASSGGGRSYAAPRDARGPTPHAGAGTVRENRAGSVGRIADFGFQRGERVRRKTLTLDDV